MCLYSWNYAINHNENGDENKKKESQTDLGLDMDTNTENMRSVSVWWCLFVLSNTYLSNT